MAGSSYLPNGADAKRAGALAALGNAADAASRVAEIAGQWASCLSDADAPCPSVRLSANLHPEDAKQFGMLRRAAPTVKAARSAAGYGGCVSRLLSAYGEQLRTLERICGAKAASSSGAGAPQTVFARLREALALLRKALSRSAGMRRGGGGAKLCGSVPSGGGDRKGEGGPEAVARPAVRRIGGDCGARQAASRDGVPLPGRWRRQAPHGTCRPVRVRQGVRRWKGRTAVRLPAFHADGL